MTLRFKIESGIIWVLNTVFPCIQCKLYGTWEAITVGSECFKYGRSEEILMKFGAGLGSFLNMSSEFNNLNVHFI